MDFLDLTGVATSTIESFGVSIFSGTLNFFLYVLQFIFPFILLIAFLFLVWGLLFFWRGKK